MKAIKLEFIPNATEKAFGIAGETYQMKERLKELGGVWSPSRKAWLFSKRRIDTVCQALNLQPGKQVATRKAAAKRVKVAEKAAPDPERIPLKILLGHDPQSVRHLAIQFFLGGGKVRPEDVTRYTGLFGRDQSGAAYGQSERKSVFPMLNSAALPLDSLASDLLQDYPYFHPEDLEAALMEVLVEFAGRGGKAAMHEECERLYKAVDLMPF